MNKRRLLAPHPNTNLLYGLNRPATCCEPARRAGRHLARHLRWGECGGARVGSGDLCADASVYSPVLTGVMMPEGVDADAVRRVIYERFDLLAGHWSRQRSAAACSASATSATATTSR